MPLKHYDSLRNFVIVAQHPTIASAAKALCLTKSALSVQLQRLESELGFKLFDRHARGIALTDQGRALLTTAHNAFEQIENAVSGLTDNRIRTLTIGVSTYFASRWLSPRLMDYIRLHPDVRLRIQPMIDLLDFQGEGVDIAIRWGNGAWSDCAIEPLFICPAWAVGNSDAFARVQAVGLGSAFSEFTLLRDRENSVAWSDWYERAGLPLSHRADTLIIPDPNVRVQAVLDGQGIALNDRLVAEEISRGTLHRLTDVSLHDYGYFLAYRSAMLDNPDASDFIDWIKRIP